MMKQVFSNITPYILDIFMESQSFFYNLYRRKKGGFGFPLVNWQRTELKCLASSTAEIRYVVICKFGAMRT